VFDDREGKLALSLSLPSPPSTLLEIDCHLITIADGFCYYSPMIGMFTFEVKTRVCAVTFGHADQPVPPKLSHPGVLFVGKRNDARLTRGPSQFPLHSSPCLLSHTFFWGGLAPISITTELTAAV